jgi:subtilisin family serine protease
VHDNATTDLYTGAVNAWNDLGLTGKGLTVGIIDTGIDYYHADFGGTGAAAYAADDSTVVETGSFPTVKVVGGYDFVGDAYNADNTSATYDPIPHPDADPLDCSAAGHGTHVAGTAAGAGVLADGSTFTGPYNATTISSHTWNVAPGAAPEASIRAYRVFGCDGSANDDVILAAIDRAVSDGVNVISMSLGSTWGNATDPLQVALDNASKAGVLSVVAAGNEGSNAYMVGGPSTANSVLSVAATDTSSATLPAVSITGDITMSAQNSNEFTFPAGAISGTLVDVGLGCSDADFAPAAGKIAVAHRGSCTRVERAVHATNAGALAVVFINNAAGYPPVEGPIDGATVPFVGVPASAGSSFVDGAAITLAASAPISNPAYTNFASFSSNGPRQDSAAKPDISAPGVSILSAAVGTGTSGELLSGTSMATPHAAGLALLVRQAHPTWSPAAVKGALMSTANPAAVGDWNVRRGGTGMVSARNATDTVAYFSTRDGRDNLSFGFRQLSGPWSETRTIRLTNTSNTTITYDLSTQLDTLGLSGFAARLEPSVARVEAHGTKEIEVTLRIRDPQHLPDALSDDAGGLSTISGLLIATPRSVATGVYTLRAALLLVPYGVSDIQARAVESHDAVSAIRVTNKGVHSGTVDTYAWIGTDRRGDAPSALVPDLRDVGVQSFAIAPGVDLAVFSISLYNTVATHPTNEYDLVLDTTGDGVPDFYVITADNGLYTAGTPDGLLASFVFDSSFNLIDELTASAPANGSTIEVPLILQDIGSPSGSVAVEVDGWTVLSNDAPDVMTTEFTPSNIGVSNGDFVALEPGARATVPVSINRAAARQQGILGWLVVSLDDAAGASEVDRVSLRND